MEKQGMVCFVVLILTMIPILVFAEEPPSLPYIYNSIVPESPNLKTQNTIRVDLYTGASVYSYPIDAPIGTNKLQPIVNYVYNSHNSKSRDILGSGWDLSQSYIQRDTNYSFYDTSDDKYNLFIIGPNQDPIMFDLVYSDEEKRFYTEIESYLYIKNETGTNNEKGVYWTVRSKGGNTYRFGFNNDSEMISNQYDYGWRWSIDLVNDTHNNSIFYSYLENPYPYDEGAIYPNTIEYNNDRQRQIRFIYESIPRPDMLINYEDGNKWRKSRRLKEIVIHTSDELVRRYVFSYELLNNLSTLSFLSNITIYGSDNLSKLPSTIFKYHELTEAWVDNEFSSKWETPFDFVSSSYRDLGYKLIDINNDGFVDILYAKDGNPADAKDVWLNNGSGWVNDSYSKRWTPPIFFVHDAGEDCGARFGDLNGDGLVDIIYGNSGGVNKGRGVWLNNGSGWVNDSTARLWMPDFDFVNYVGKDLGYRLIDLNKDGLIDIMKSLDGNPSDSKDVWLNNGSGWVNDSYSKRWTPPTFFAEGNGYDKGVRFGDLNGDGLVDMLYGRRGGGKDVWLNNGSGWVSDNNSKDWLPPEYFVSSSYRDLGYRLSDINGDGLVDLLWGRKEFTYGGRKAWINNGSGWSESTDIWSPKQDFVYDLGQDNGIRLGDLNGDGMVDMIYAKSGPGGRTVWINNISEPYFIKNITIPLGGTSYINYMKSTYLNNLGNDTLYDLGFNIWVVSNSTTYNGMIFPHNVTSITHYNYSGGKYDYIKHEFRGFNYVGENLEDKKVDHWFYQDDAKKGLEYLNEISDNKGKIFQKSKFKFNSTRINNHFVNYLIETSELLYDGISINPKIKNSSFNYDEFGNVIRIHNLGDISDSKDDKYEYFEYVYSSEKWIVDRIKRYALYNHDNSEKKREIFFTYDNLPYNYSPLKGKLTSKEDWLNEGENPVTAYQYDQFGNLINETDANNHSTEYKYGLRDPTFTFVEMVINAEGHKTGYFYDFGIGKLIAETDPNGISKNYSYDVFGRLVQEILPYDDEILPTKNYTYFYDGFAPEFIKISKREDSGQVDTFNEFYFYDGFQRLIQKKNDAENDQQSVYDNYYDNFGRLKKISNPYFSNNIESYTSPNQTVNSTGYVYDQLNRIIEVHNSDGTQKNLTYDHWNITMYDENKNMKVTQKNAYDKIIRVQEYNNGETYITNYYYDPVMNLISIEDSSQNTFNYSYDSLGRQTQMNDPDLGQWNYFYDSVGNLIEQKDNRGVSIFIDYDKINRIAKKISSTENISYTYDEIMNNTLSKVEREGSSLIYNYDNRLRKVGEEKIIDTMHFKLNTTYDSMDRVKTRTLPQKEVIYYEYNDQNLMDSVRGFVEVDYNEKNQPIIKRYNNSLETNYGYNDMSYRLTQINTEEKQQLSYDYDSVGNVVEIDDTKNNKTSQMSYDGLNRLISANRTDDYIIIYSYDPIGNLINLTKETAELETISFIYNQTPVHAPNMIIQIGQFDDPNKFIFQNSSGSNIAWFGDEGNIVLKGTCSAGSPCTAPADSFIFKDSSGNEVGHVDPDGNLCIEDADCNDGDADCNPVNDAFIIQDDNNINQTYIDLSDGELCLTGSLIENGGP